METIQQKNWTQAVLTDMANHTVEITLPGESEIQPLYLVMTEVLVNPRQILLENYGGEIGKTFEALVAKFFPDAEEKRWFGLLFSQEGKIVFSFPIDFAFYDEKTKTICQKGLDDLFSGLLKEHASDEGLPKIPHRFEPSTERRRSGAPPDIHSMVLKYAVIKKPD